MLLKPFCPTLARFASSCLLFLAAVLSGCGGSNGASVSTSTAGTPALTLSAGSLSFAATTVGSSSATQTVTLTNSGSGTATISVASVTLSDTTNYALTSNCSGGTFGPGTSCSLSITFTPKSAATLPATLSIADNLSGSPQTVTITGTGTAAPVLSPAVTLSATSFSFPATQVGSSAPLSGPITLTNSGTATLTLSSIVLSDTKDFNMSTTCTSTLAAGANCGISFGFTPQSAGTLSASIVLTDNAATSPQTIALTGSGTAPQAAVSPSAATFSAVITNSSTGSQGSSSIMLANAGSATLTGIGLTISGTGASVFSVASTTCGTTLAAGATCGIVVNFSPASAGSYNATLSVTDNATGAPQTVALTGTATTPGATLSTASILFPGTAVGSTSAVSSVTLTNSGTASLSISGITLGGTNPANFAETSTCGSSLAVGAACTISATFSPAAAQSYSATVTLTDNATNTPQVISLSGNGTAPALTLSASSITFPGTAVGSTSPASSLTLTNSGNAPLTINGISLGGTNAGAFAQTTTCGATLAAAASCTISATFTPAAGQTYNAGITITSNASGSPQTVALTGTGLAPAASLSATSITFPGTTLGTTSAASSTTLTNSGNASLTISSLVLGGTNPSDFTSTNTCGTTLAAAASCTISATFTPAAAQTYGATLTLTDNAAGSPQTITLSGTGTAAAVTRTLYTFPASFPESLPDTSVNALYALINNAQTSIDMTMYELVDTTFSGDLVAACNRGVRVRVILDASLEKSSNTAAYNQLNTAGTNCSAVFSNTAFQATHEKSILIDGVTSVIMTLNLTSRYYTTTRDFALVENDAADYAAIEAAFNADYAAGTPYGGTQGTSDFSYTPALGDDLIWSPTTAQAAMLSIINNAQSTLLIENEELSSSTNSTIVAALASACQRGVVVHFTIVNETSYQPQFQTIKNAGCSVHTYPDTSTGFYVHAKVVVADYGQTTQNVYMGSINYSSASMNQNRELGLFLSDNAAVQMLYSTLNADYASGTAY